MLDLGRNLKDRFFRNEDHIDSEVYSQNFSKLVSPCSDSVWFMPQLVGNSLCKTSSVMTSLL